MKPPRIPSHSTNRSKRALTQVGGPCEIWLDEVGLGAALESALRVHPDETATPRHVHGFHSYPARMHPDTAARLVTVLSQSGEVVLDPFVGSGTVLVEARVQGRIAYEIDANPLAVALSSLKLRGLAPDEGEHLIGVANAVAELADERRLAKAGPTRPYGRTEREWFPPHVLLELDGLWKGISELCPAAHRPALELVVSSMLTKVSVRRSDTSAQTEARRLASGFTIRFFVKKTEELVRRLQAYSASLPERELPWGVRLGDARDLPMKEGRAHAIITSPPYPGVYDYVEHHRLRLDWLKLDAKHLERHEIGAHRDFAQKSATAANEQWAEQMGDCLDEMRRVLAPSGKIALLIADSVVASRAFYADRALQDMAPRHGLKIVAGVSQERSHYHAPTRNAFRAAPRREHLIVFQAVHSNVAIPPSKGRGVVRSPSGRGGRGR
ncbi:MAG: DNA methyltransferase [Polyangiaceae bacterium]